MAGSSVERWRDVLWARCPETVAFLHPSSTLDVCSGATRQYAALIGRPLLGSAAAPKTVEQFEAEHRRGVATDGAEPDDAASGTGGGAGRDVIDRVETSIVALAWARTYLISPPKHRKAVTTTLWLVAGFFVLRSVSLAVDFYR